MTQTAGENEEKAEAIRKRLGYAEFAFEVEEIAVAEMAVAPDFGLVSQIARMKEQRLTQLLPPLPPLPPPSIPSIAGSAGSITRSIGQHY